MRRIRRLHKPEFKAKVALTAIKGEMTMAEMVKKFGVQATQITQWCQQQHKTDPFMGLFSNIKLTPLVIIYLLFI